MLIIHNQSSHNGDHIQITSGKREKTYQHQFDFSVQANQPKMQNHVLIKRGIKMVTANCSNNFLLTKILVLTMVENLPVQEIAHLQSRTQASHPYLDQNQVSSLAQHL